MSTLRAFLLSLLVPACAHAPSRSPLWDPTPITFGFYAVQCMPVRPVYCIADEYMGLAQCQSLVAPSVAALNAAAGREILHYVGPVSADEGMEHYTEGALIVMGRPQEEFLDANILALTAPLTVARNGTVCIDRVAIAIAPTVLRPVLTARRHNPWQVIMHELAHAVGAMHTDENSRFASIMDPAASTGSDHFTPADQKSLHAVYEKAFDK